MPLNWKDSTTLRPKLRMRTLSDSFISNGNLCSIKRMDTPRRLILRNNSADSSISGVLRPEAGSSSSNSLGLVASDL